MGALPILAMKLDVPGFLFFILMQAHRALQKALCTTTITTLRTLQDWLQVNRRLLALIQQQCDPEIALLPFLLSHNTSHVGTWKALILGFQLKDPILFSFPMLMLQCE